MVNKKGIKTEMNNKPKEEVLNKLLSELIKQGDGLPLDHICRDIGIDWTNETYFINRLIEEGLVKESIDGHSHLSTTLGKDIYDSGGYLKHIESEKTKLQEYEDQKDLELNKLKLEVKSLKRTPIIAWTGAITGIIGLIVSIIALLK